MRKLFVLCGVALVALLSAAPASATHKFTCTSEQTGVNVRDVVVPPDAACALIDSTVTGDVHVSRNAFLEVRGTNIAGTLRADRALTLFLNTGTTVGRRPPRSSSSTPM